MDDSPADHDGHGGDGEPDRPPGSAAEDPGTETYRTTFDAETESISMAVVLAVAALTNVEPMEMEPLGTAVNPDALESVFRPGTSGQVVFRYEDHEIVVHDDGELAITELPG